MMGAAVGIALTFPTAKLFGKQLSNYFPIFNVDPDTIYMDMAASFIIAFMAGIFPAWRAVKIRIADGLRRIG
jgi:putative ABC transport system permease protein